MKQHKRDHRRHHSGYSLAEVMVAMAILTIVILAALTIYDRSNRMFNQGVQASDMQQSTRVAFDRLVSDIRLTGFDYDRDGIPFGAMAPTWQSNTSYVLGNQVQPDPANGFVYVCTHGGTSGAAQPSWPTTSGTSVTDGAGATQVTWAYQDLVHYQQPDEQIEYAGESAITIRANFDYNTEQGPCATSGAPKPCENGREQDLESSQFPVVTTGNDEIVTYVLKSNKPGATNGDSVVFYADTDHPRDVNPSTGKKENKITIAGVDLSNNNPPYTLYRVTLDKITAQPAFTPIADNIRRMTFHYYTNTAGTSELTALPYGNGQYDGSKPDDTVAERDTRATIKSVGIDLVGMNPNIDAAFNDAADTAAPHYRKYELTSLVVPRNIGKHGLKEFNTMPPEEPTVKAVCAGACSGVYVTWGGPTSGGDIDSYNIVYDVGDCGGNPPGSAGYGTVMSCGSPSSPCTPGYSIAEDAGLNLAGYATKITPGQIYRFSIQSVNKYGAATAPNCIAVNVLNMDKPANPTDLLASGGSGGYPAVANGIQLYWTPVSTHNTSNNNTSCTDGTTKSENSIVPGENVRYRIWRSKNADFTVGDGSDKQVLNELTLIQPSVVGGKLMWLDQTAPMGSCQPFYYRMQAVTVPCCNDNSMNQGNDAALAKSAYYPDPSVLAATEGNASTTAKPAIPIGVSAVTNVPSCTGNCDVKVSWAKVIADTAGNPMNVDRYVVTVKKKDPATGLYQVATTQPVSPPDPNTVPTNTIINNLNTNGDYLITVRAHDCVDSDESTEVPWPCTSTFGTVTISIPNFGIDPVTGAEIIQSPTPATVTFSGAAASVSMIVTEGSTVIGGTAQNSPPNPTSPYTFTIPKTDDGVPAKVHFTITGTGAGACAYSIDQWVIDEAPPPCALMDANSDSTVMSWSNTAPNQVDITLKNTSGDILKPQSIYIVWNTSNNGPAKFASGISSVVFDQAGSPTTATNASCSGSKYLAQPSTTPTAIAANQQDYKIRVNFAVQAGKTLTGNPIQSVCVQYQSPSGDIKTCSVAPNAGTCPMGTCP